MPNKKPSLYAPRHEHESWGSMRNQTWGFRKIWNDFIDALRDLFTLGRVDNGTGSKRTVYNDIEGNLRYDREKPCRSYGHPHDNFMNYSVQANLRAPNHYLRNLAAGGNGGHRASDQSQAGAPAFGGSTIANVNLQQRPGRPLTGDRVRWAINHSAAYAEPLYVLHRDLNISSVPGNIRQAGAVYHSNPYEPWPQRTAAGNPYNGCSDTGELPPRSQYYMG